LATDKEIKERKEKEVSAASTEVNWQYSGSHADCLELVARKSEQNEITYEKKIADFCSEVQ
jgi:hypothetical protein